MVMVEAIKNLCALTIIKGYEQYMEFNLRKYQTAHCGEGISAISNSGGSSSSNSNKAVATTEGAATADAVAPSDDVNDESDQE